jgi:hypothetical protein
MGLGRGSEIRDLGSRKNLSRIQGSKRHRIPDPDPQHCPVQQMENRNLLTRLCVVGAAALPGGGPALPRYHDPKTVLIYCPHPVQEMEDRNLLTGLCVIGAAALPDGRAA